MFRCLLEPPDFSLHLFDDSDFQMESSARCLETDATSLLEKRENNQNKNKGVGRGVLGCP